MAAEPQPSGGTDYAEYLLIDDLLRLQRPFTPEAHDEISPHDLPLDHPGREEAEHQAGGEEGETRGNT